MGAKILAPAEGWWPSATDWGPFGPSMGALWAPWTNTNTYIAQIQIQIHIAQIQIHIGCKYKYNNRGQIRYGVVVVV